jgi:hypothetical protein
MGRDFGAAGDSSSLSGLSPLTRYSSSRSRDLVVRLRGELSPTALDSRDVAVTSLHSSTRCWRNATRASLGTSTAPSRHSQVASVVDVVATPQSSGLESEAEHGADEQEFLGRRRRP